MKNVIIFGTKDLAQLAKYYFEHDPEYAHVKVSGFTVDSQYKTVDQFEGLPVYDFETLEQSCSPSDYSLFAPVTGAKANRVREDIYKRGKEKGYEFISYISSFATNFADSIGDNCFILEDNTLQPFVKIGNNVVMWSGNHIGHHSIIGDNVFFTSHVVLSGHCVVGDNAWFGVNSTVRDGANISKGSLVAMAACITKDTEEWSVYMGMPAKKSEGKFSYEVL